MDATHSGPERVLLVDGDPVHRAELGGQLGQAGFVVATVPRGADALDLLAEFRPTAMVADIDARGGATGNLVEAVRQHPQGASLPVLVMGDADHAEQFQQMLALGRVWYISRQSEWGHFERTFQTMLLRSDVGPALL